MPASNKGERDEHDGVAAAPARNRWVRAGAHWAGRRPQVATPPVLVGGSFLHRVRAVDLAIGEVVAHDVPGSPGGENRQQEGGGDCHCGQNRPRHHVDAFTAVPLYSAKRLGAARRPLGPASLPGPARLGATTGRRVAHAFGPGATCTLEAMMVHRNESGIAPDGPPVKSHRMVLPGPVFPDSRIDLG